MLDVDNFGLFAESYRVIIACLNCLFFVYWFTIILMGDTTNDKITVLIPISKNGLWGFIIATICWGECNIHLLSFHKVNKLNYSYFIQCRHVVKTHLRKVFRIFVQFTNVHLVYGCSLTVHMFTQPSQAGLGQLYAWTSSVRLYTIRMYMVYACTGNRRKSFDSKYLGH